MLFKFSDLSPSSENIESETNGFRSLSISEVLPEHVPQKEKIVFQLSFFSGELLVLGGVSKIEGIG